MTVVVKVKEMGLSATPRRPSSVVSGVYWNKELGTGLCTGNLASDFTVTNSARVLCVYNMDLLYLFYSIYR